MSVLLTAQKLSAGYGDREIVHDVSFELQAHTLTALLGPNGCGKTTLIRCVINQLRHSGQCILDEKVLELLSTRQRAREISYIAQRSGMSISLPVIDVVLMGFNPSLRILEYPGRRHKVHALEALELVGMKHCAEADFQTLSEGQKQLVLLARTIVEDTAFLVLDEPDSALDFQNRYQMLKVLKMLVQSRRKAGLLCLHDPGLALEFCDQILLMKDGRIVQILRPQEDDLGDMETGLRELYGEVSVAECFDRNGKRHRTLIWEG